MIMLKYELKKIFSIKVIVAICICLLLEIMWQYYPKSHEHNYSVEVYKKYMTEFYGPYSEEKHKAILERYNEIQGILSSHDEYVNKYYKDEIEIEEFEKHNDLYIRATVEEKTVKYVLDKCEYYSTTNDINIFFFDTHLEEFIMESSDFDWFTFGAIAIYVISVFGMEYRSEARELLVITRKGRAASARLKLFIASFGTALIVFLCYLIKLLFFIKEYGLSGNDFCITNIYEFRELRHLKIIGYYYYMMFIRIVSWSILATFFCLISILVKNTIVELLIIFVIVIIPALLSSTLVDGIIFISSSLLGGKYGDNFNTLEFACLGIIKMILYKKMIIDKWIN